MKLNIYYLFLFVVLASACTNHAAKHENENGHQHDDVKLQFTAYSNDFELFAETDPFSIGNSSGILAHFTHLNNFKALESGQVTASLRINGKEIQETCTEPARKGIYKFSLTPEISGKGQLIFSLKTDSGTFVVEIPEIEVFADEHDAIHEAEDHELSAPNATVFTKEQSWKIDFRTELPRTEPFGQVIKTSALVQPAPEDELLITAKTSGTVRFSNTNLTSGGEISRGAQLFVISGDDLADNNSALRFSEAQNNYEKAKTNFDRMSQLAKDKIVSEKDLLESKTSYENAKALYMNLKTNFNQKGQSVSAPITGFAKQLMVTNGQFVEAGQPLVSLAKNQLLHLQADVQQKYAPLLSGLKSATIRIPGENKTFTLDELDGKLVGYGRSANSTNFMIPVHLQIKNPGRFTSGSIVEVFLQTASEQPVITVPNQALLEDQGNYFVFVQVHPELFEKRMVKPGESDGLRTGIKSGISASDRLVTQGAVMIKLAQSSGALDAHSGHVH